MAAGWGKGCLAKPLVGNVEGTISTTELWPPSTAYAEQSFELLGGFLERLRPTGTRRSLVSSRYRSVVHFPRLNLAHFTVLRHFGSANLSGISKLFLRIYKRIPFVRIVTLLSPVNLLFFIQPCVFAKNICVEYVKYGYLSSYSNFLYFAWFGGKQLYKTSLKAQ
jgi:hypothetical protein